MPVALVVDDEPSIRNLFEAFLSLQGYTVRTAADGVEALTQIQQEHPSLVLLDNHMPRMTGLELLQHLRSCAPEVPVILMSGLLDAEMYESAQRLGARACLQKPIGLPDLKRCLAAVQSRPRLRLLLADDHPVVRQGLAALLRQEEDLEVLGEAADGKIAVEMACNLRPDVVLMDVNMPVMNGLEATRAIRAACPKVSIIGFSVHDRSLQAPPMMEAGAVGYVGKTEPIDVLLAMIRTCRALGA